VAENLKIREMRPEEREALVDLIVSVFEKTSIAKNIAESFGAINGLPWQEDKADHARKDLENSDVVLVGEIEGKPAAVLTLTYNRKFATGSMGHLAVAARFQGRGVGRSMLGEGFARLESDGLKYAAIDCLDQNAGAEGLYKSEGFVEVARKVMMFRAL